MNDQFLVIALEILNDRKALTRRAKHLRRVSVWLRRAHQLCTWLNLDTPAWLERWAGEVRTEAQFLKSLTGAGYGRN